MKNYKMILQYDGTRYDGWQRQKNTERTIQGRVESVLERLSGIPVEIHGAGRTDAGVHALGQTANFHMKSDMTAGKIMEYLNQYLPEDIAVLSAAEVPERFHSRLNASWKTYLYRIDMSDKKNVFERKYIYGLGKRLDLERMRQAAALLLGEHDFRSFCSNKNLKKSSVRSLKSIDLESRGTVLEIRYVGNGFLYHMARILTGTLIEVGSGKRQPSDISGILEARDRQASGYTAPPEGLFLERVSYEDNG